MKNDTMNNTATELDFNDLETVSGGGFFDYAKKVSKNFWEDLLDILL